MVSKEKNLCKPEVHSIQYSHRILLTGGEQVETSQAEVVQRGQGSVCSAEILESKKMCSTCRTINKDFKMQENLLNDSLRGLKIGNYQLLLSKFLGHDHVLFV